MKPGRFLLIIVLFLVSFAGSAQTVSFSGRDVTLKQVFASIKSQAGIFFFYDAALLQDAKPVTVQLNSVPLATALNEIFKGQSLTWSLENKTVTVVKTPALTNPTPPPSAAQQPHTIQVNGTITNAEGNSIQGVSVAIKGTRQGTISDNTGRFTIHADPKNILVFSSVNYGSKELQVKKGEMNIKLQLDIKPMESLMVGGNLNAIRRKADATSVTVLDAKTLEKIPANTLDQVFRGWVPGTNSFDVGPEPEGFPALSIRGAAGANSLSTIAVYIDGIEYAGGSGYLSQLDKTNIDRIEIVRGPGAATMYGTGSNGGIVQIFTKKGLPGQTKVDFTTSAGFYKSKWVKSNPLQQMHNLETVNSFKKVTIKLGGSYRTVGAYLPDGGEKNKGIYASAGFNQGKLQANLTIRYNVRNFHLSRRPYYDTAIHPRTDIIIEPSPGVRTPAYVWFNVRPTASSGKNGITETHVNGINLSHRTTKNWVNSLDAGYTSNSSSEVPVSDGITPLQRQYVSNKYNTTTVRYSNSLRLRTGDDRLAVVITSGAEYKENAMSTSFTRATAASSLIIKDPNNENYGAFVQLNPSYKNVYLTMGLRYEKNELFKPAWNPRLGLTTNFDTRALTIKPRISWGKGITSPAYGERFGQPANNVTIVYANPNLKPQSQQGFDYGLEIYDKNGKYKFEAVYYDNILQDLITEAILGSDPRNPRLAAFMFTNVAKVANTGWELSGEYETGHFSVRGTFSIINSTIKDTTGAWLNTSLKDRAPGTRMINLPKNTSLFNLNYNFYKLFGKADKGVVSVNITGVAGIRYTDYRKYILDVAYGRTPYIPGIFGEQVENSVFRVGLFADYSVASDLRFFVQGANILNSYEYEHSSDYPTHGATWLFGIKYNFSKGK